MKHIIATMTMATILAASCGGNRDNVDTQSGLASLSVGKPNKSNTTFDHWTVKVVRNDPKAQNGKVVVQEKTIDVNKDTDTTDATFALKEGTYDIILQALQGTTKVVYDSSLCIPNQGLGVVLKAASTPTKVNLSACNTPTTIDGNVNVSIIPQIIDSNQPATTPSATPSTVTGYPQCPASATGCTGSSTWGWISQNSVDCKDTSSLGWKGTGCSCTCPTR